MAIVHTYLISAKLIFKTFSGFWLCWFFRQLLSRIVPRQAIIWHYFSKTFLKLHSNFGSILFILCMKTVKNIHGLTMSLLNRVTSHQGTLWNKKDPSPFLPHTHPPTHLVSSWGGGGPFWQNFPFPPSVPKMTAVVWRWGGSSDPEWGSSKLFLNGSASSRERERERRSISFPLENFFSPVYFTNWLEKYFGITGHWFETHSALLIILAILLSPETFHLNSLAWYLVSNFVIYLKWCSWV